MPSAYGQFSMVQTADTLSLSQSPFIGRRTPLVEDGSPLLYPRYTHVSEILLVRQSRVTHFVVHAALQFPLGSYCVNP